MVNITNYIKMSSECEKSSDSICTAEYLKQNYFKLGKVERNSLLNFLLISSFCFAFKTKPIVYEQITQYLADKFELDKINIVLIGSAKTGFAIDTNNYGRNFSESSDLDFAIIDNKLFEKSIKDFRLWKNKTDNGEYPENKKNKYWVDNQNNLKAQIKKGFIDTYKVPNFEEFTTTQQINQSLSLIVINLKQHQNIVVKEASVRIYNSWETFQKQLRLNIENVLSRLDVE